jgi:hypothetical protein
MSQVRFLFDADTDPDLIEALVSREPGIDVLRAGWPGAPPTSTADPELLLFAEAEGRLLVSRDKKTMPGHLVAHFSAGHHTSGVVLLREGFGFGVLVEELLLIWAASEAEDWLDRTFYLPD